MELSQVLVAGIGQGCLYGLIALGFVLIYKSTEIVNFAQGDMMMLGAFAGVTFIGILGFPYWAGFLLTIVVMAVFGYLLDMLVTRSIIGEPQFAAVILTISLGFVFRSAAAAVWGADFLTLETPFSGETFNFKGLIVGYENLAVIAGTIILSVLLYVFFKRSGLGMAIQASSQNQLAAYYMGVPVKRVFSSAWAIGAMIAAAAGILIAPISLVNPEMGFIGIKAFAVAVIGGFGSLPGVLLAGVAIGVVEQLAAAYLPAGFGETITYLIMFLVLTIRPQGLFSQTQQKKV